MGLLPKVIERLFRPERIEQRANVTDSSWFQVINGLTNNGKVAYVTPKTAMSINALFACVNLITETATLIQPKIWQYDINGKRQILDHDQLPLLTRETNSYTSAIEFDKIWTASYLIWGNGYAEIIRNGRTGRPVAYINLEPWLVKVEIQNGEKVYLYSPDGTFEKPSTRLIKSRNMLHLADLSWDNVKGISRIELNKGAINEYQNMVNYSDEMYSNGINLTGFIYGDKPLADGAAELLRKSFESKYQSKSGQVGILPYGYKYEPMRFNIPMADAEIIEAKKMGVEDMARIFRCPLTLIQRGESADNKGDNEYNTFLTTVMAPLVILKSAELNRKIFRKAELTNTYVKYELKGLYRTDIKTRYEAHRIALDGGFMCPDEVRAIEDMDAIPDGTGTIYRVPMNYIPSTNFKDYNPQKNSNGTT